MKKDNFKVEITFNMKRQYNYQSLFAWTIIFIGYWFLPKATITLCDLLSRLFCIDATLLCEFESDKIWINEFQ